MNKRKYTRQEKMVMIGIGIFLLCVGLYIYKTYFYQEKAPEKSNEPLIEENSANKNKTTSKPSVEDKKVSKNEESAEKIFRAFLEIYPTFDAEHPTEHIEKAKDMLEENFYKELLQEQENQTLASGYKIAKVTKIQNISSKKDEGSSVYWKGDVTTENYDDKNQLLSTVQMQYIATVKVIDGKLKVIDFMQQGKGAKLHE